MLKKVEDLTASGFKGLNTNPNILGVTKEYSPNMMDVKVNYDGSIEKRLGTNTQNSIILSASAGAGFSPDSASLLASSINSYWPLNEPSGTRQDVIGTVNLTDSGNTLYSGGIKGVAALFAAATGMALYAVNPPTLTGNKNFSISSWIYLNSTSTTLQRTIVSKKDLATGADYTLLLHMDGTHNSSAFTDSSLNNTTMTTANNARMDTGIVKFGSSSFVTTGGAYISVGSMNNGFNFGTGDFTIDFWYRSISGPPNNSYFWSYGNAAGDNVLRYVNGSLEVDINGVSNVLVPVVAMSNNLFQHIALVRKGTTIALYVDGTKEAEASNSASIGSNNTLFTIGAFRDGTLPVNGWIDEFRVIKGRADYAQNFTPATSAYSNPSTPREIEYWLYVDTNNKATFDISSSGTVANGSVVANSFGVLQTQSWYNVVGWLDTTNGFVGVSVNLSVNTASYTTGIITSSAPFTIGADSAGAGNFMDGRIDETGYWPKVLTAQNRIDLYNVGSGNTYSRAFDTQTWASMDFGASALRWLVCSAGTGIYASSNLGVTWVNIATDRSATYQYLDRSKNVMIATSDAYDTPLYWSGSSGTFAAMLNNSAPLCKFSINHQGFLILLNSNTRKRIFAYNDENTQLTGAWTNNFDIPSSFDDEITAAFVLRRYLYVSTRYTLWRISYVGGNPDWQFIKIKDWGFVPRTVDKIVLTNPQLGNFAYSIGEVAIGLTWDRKIRIFDGAGDQIVSNYIEKDNQYCDFAVNKIGYFGSGPVISFARTNPNENIYKLIIAIGANSQATTHMINFDARGTALYPYQNQPYNTMCMAESSNQRFMMAFDRSGFCHMLDSGNLDANTTAINEIYDSSILFDKSPSQSTKSHKVDFFFSNTTSGTLNFSDRLDFGDTFNQRKVFYLNGSDKKLVTLQSVDVPETYNALQFRLSSSGTSNPWRMMRYDHFAQGEGIGINQ